MPDRHVAGHGRQRLLLEHLADQTQVFEDQDLRTVADCDPGGLLAAVLQRIEAVIGELGYIFAGGPNSEDTAFFTGGVLKVYYLLVWHVSAAPGGTGLK
ncbi:hypothetical protein MMIN_10870 [Mycolicibacter minnesotensis]|nr:hypothetical protein MMIN_10870 [Mycolicibacter minnesotensis]